MSYDSPDEISRRLGCPLIIAEDILNYRSALKSADHREIVFSIGGVLSLLFN